MTIATPADQTRIFFDRARFYEAMTPAKLQSALNELNFNAEVFTMASQVGIDCLTIELADLIPVLKRHNLI